ncbi:DegT/DnrJ/EryC1/StrS family aminotransferase [Magnetovirga frankeli]|uniref:DegT/DnrJ/EryC1/StrS family aminotransferase n=1 Tax=Magnetovirga frankeli TaxID=947516 RepID=UPI0012930C01|nr:DegT/DnrJ/EryC1/StrS family aminotransferase [gamma proteobacterium SS-5]
MILQSNPKAAYLERRKAIDAALARVLESGWYILGREVEGFEAEFAQAMGANWAVGVANGTDAIEIALRALGIKAGDRVVTVSHTAVATVAAIKRIDAVPLFVDVDPRRYTMDPESLDALLSTPDGGRAKAIVLVHLYGQPVDMKTIVPMARARGLSIIEDCAQAHGALLDGRIVGTWGDLACFSFYPTKNLGALGDGGAVTGINSSLRETVQLLRTYGWKNRYVSDLFGINSRLDELQASILRVGLQHLNQDNERRRAIAARYNRSLAGISVELPWQASNAYHVFHQYVIATNGRNILQERLKRLGVGSLVHYPMAVHQQPAYADPTLRPVDLPHTERLVGRILSLPMYPQLRDDEIEEVVTALHTAIED